MSVQSSPTQSESGFPQLLKKPMNALRHSIARRGVIGTVTFLPLAVCRITHRQLRRLSPTRLRSGRADAEFDVQFGVETCREVELRDLHIQSDNLVHGQGFQSTTHPDFRTLMQAIPTDLTNHVFVDLGSGKGRTLMMATEFPFAQIIGVEFARELHDVAERNLSVFSAPWEIRCNDVKSICADATNFEFPASNVVLYMYNPFDRPVMEQVLENIDQSLAQSPRDFLVVYNNPVQGDLFLASSRFDMLESGEDWMIFRSKV